MRNSSSVAKSAERIANKTPKLKLSVQYAAHVSSIPSRSEFRKWVKAALKQDAEIVLRIVEEAEGRNLNRDFRNRDYATNVLTFSYENVKHDSNPLVGDIVLCASVIEREVSQQHKVLAAHYAHLTVHGVLHLQGYDHETEADAAVMEQLETQIVEKLGYRDPYRGAFD
jgi:probable rRNA maturation factor